MVKNFFNISDLSEKNIEDIIQNKSSNNLKGKKCGPIFENIRTRISTESTILRAIQLI